VEGSQLFLGPDFVSASSNPFIVFGTASCPGLDVGGNASIISVNESAEETSKHRVRTSSKTLEKMVLGVGSIFTFLLEEEQSESARQTTARKETKACTAVLHA